MTAILFPICSIRKDLLKVSNNKDMVNGGFLELPLLTDTSACTNRIYLPGKNFLNASHNASDWRLRLHCLLENNFWKFGKEKSTQIWHYMNFRNC